MKLLLTGSASHLARSLLPRLCADTRIKQIIGVDLKPAFLSHAKYQHHQIDIRQRDQLQALMPGMDALIHLAFVVMPGDLKKNRFDRELIRDINVNGSRQVFELACEFRLSSLLHLSSAAVYGAWPDNPPQMTETQPLRAMPGFAYAEDKVAVEQILDELQQRSDAPRIVRLRPHVILGQHAQPLLLYLLRQPFYPRFDDPQPLTQCVWEEDVSDGILRALFSTHHGAFNLAADPPLPFREMIRQQHRISFGLPFPLINALHRWLWKFSGAAGDPAWNKGMQYHLAVSSQRAHSLLGWKPQKSTTEILSTTRQWR